MEPGRSSRRVKQIAVEGFLYGPKDFLCNWRSRLLFLVNYQ